jgi:hypothetical protein
VKNGSSSEDVLQIALKLYKFKHPKEQLCSFIIDCSSKIFINIWVKTKKESKKITPILKRLKHLLAREGESGSECVLKGSKIVEGVIVIKGDPRLICVQGSCLAMDNQKATKMKVCAIRM